MKGMYQNPCETLYLYSILLDPAFFLDYWAKHATLVLAKLANILAA